VEFTGPYEVVHGEENPKTGDLFIEVVLAESGYLNQATPPVGYLPQTIEQMHNDKVWEGKVINAHPSKNHPLVYEPRPKQGWSVAQKVAHYMDKSAKWGFGTIIKTKLSTLKDGINKRLSGIFHIKDEGAKKAWREGKFPKYNSSSVFILDRDANTGLIKEAIPIASTMVDNPANPLDVAAIQNVCEGGDSCIHKLAESSDHNCLYCRYTVLANFVNKFSSNSIGNVSESSMVNDAEASNPNDTQEAVTTITDETTSASGKPLGENKEKEVVTDYKALAESLQKELNAKNKELKIETEKNADNTKEITQIKKDKLESKIREILAKVPMFAFENKEENKEEVVKNFMKKFGKLDESEILQDVRDRFALSQKLLTIQQKQTASQNKQVAESSRNLITNDGKLNVPEEDISESGKRSSILKIDEVFG
jgi:hypothetical protein